MGLLQWVAKRLQRGGGASRPDPGEAPPEVVAVAAEMEPGRALELGTGNGTNVLYLAQRGWFAIGIDGSASAVDAARHKADWVAGATFVEGDVTRLSQLGVDGPFDLVLDIGCYERIAEDRRDAYAQEVGRVAGPGSRFLMRLPGRYEPEIRRRFGDTFELTGVSPGREPPGAAWLTLTRRAS